MFDIGFWELCVIGVIGLLVLGPERLPQVARKVGLYIRKARQSWNSIRSDIEAELHNEEIKKSFSEPLAEINDATGEIRRQSTTTLKDVEQRIQQNIDLASESAPDTPTPDQAADPDDLPRA